MFSGIYYYDEVQKAQAEATKNVYQQELNKMKYGTISTEIKPVTEFYYAEDYHQQYLHKNTDGYCGIGGTGVTCPTGVVKGTWYNAVVGCQGGDGKGKGGKDEL